MANGRGRVEIFVNPPTFVRCPTCGQFGVGVFWHRGYDSWYVLEHLGPYTAKDTHVYSCPRSAKSLGKYWTFDLMEFV